MLLVTLQIQRSREREGEGEGPREREGERLEIMGERFTVGNHSDSSKSHDNHVVVFL